MLSKAPRGNWGASLSVAVRSQDDPKSFSHQRKCHCPISSSADSAMPLQQNPTTRTRLTKNGTAMAMWATTAA